MKKMKLNFNLDFGVISVEQQYKMMVDNRNDNKPLPENWEIMINNYLVVKTQHKKKLEKKLEEINKDISDSYHVLKELKEKCKQKK